MKPLNLLFGLIFLLVLKTGIVFSQPYLFEVEPLIVEGGGLPEHNTRQIIQDHDGYIWISRQGAIVRYDGIKYKEYNYTKLNIAKDQMPFLALDKDAYLWYCELGHLGGSGVIDTANDSIYTIEEMTEGRIAGENLLFVSNSSVKENEIFLISRSGAIYSYDGSWKLIYQFPRPINEGTQVYVKAGFNDDYLISYWKNSLIKHQLIRVKEGEIMRKYNLDDLTFWGLSSTRNGGIIETYAAHKKENGSCVYYKLINDELIPHPALQDIADDVVRVYQFHEDYICYYDKRGKLIARDKEGKQIWEKDIHINRTTNMRSVFTDRQGIIWVATGNGIYRILARKNPFELIGQKNPKGAVNSIRGIYEDEEYLWWGGYEGNFRINKKTGAQEEILVKGGAALNFLKDNNEDLWIGSANHFVHQYRPDIDEFIQYKFRRGYTTPFQNPVTENFWLGTIRGWYFMDKPGGKETPATLPVDFKNVAVRQFYQNEEGIWIATGHGIFLIDSETEQILEHYTIETGLSSNSINHIHEDEKGIFWIGTSDAGLLRWDRTRNTFQQFTKENYLANDNIYAVYEDDSSRLWLPSDEGLMCFDKTSYKTKVFLEKDGIAHKEFNTFSHFRAKEGTFYFGGLNGMTKFHPKDIATIEDYEIPLYLSKVQVLKEDEEGFSDQTQAYQETGQITFSPQDRILELETSLLDYSGDFEKQYAYRLNNQQWINTKEDKITIMNPSPGRYTIAVKAKTASGSWSKVLNTPFQVKAPFYRQLWFIISSILGSIFLIFLANRQRIKRLEANTLRLEEEVRKRTWRIEQDKATISQQAEELKTLDQAKTRFFSNITHEFRTPLTLIIGPAEKSLAEDLPPAFRPAMQGMLNNARSLLGLINQLLDISKLESAEMRVEVSHGNLVKYTESLLHQFDPLIVDKQISINFKADVPIWETHFDKDKWGKIVMNLISNAVKFTPKGGTIDVDLKEIEEVGNTMIELKVEDTGKGIAPEFLTNIFDRFYRSSDHSHTIGGTGIGLSLVKELVELQNGQVLVSSTLGKGTVFTVKIPLAEPSDTIYINETDSTTSDLTIPANLIIPASLVENKIPDAENTKNKGKLSLLIIEDNAEMRSFIRSCLDAEVYNFIEAADGEEGLKKAWEIVPDLIISDVMMPHKDGFEVIRGIRSNLVTSHIPLILLTARAALESRLKGFTRGADAYMTKPFSPEELAIRIKKLIELRQLLQQRYAHNGTPKPLQGFEKEDAFVREIKDHIDKNIDEQGLNVETIARHFGMSRMQLHRKMKTLVQHSPGDFIRIIRLEKAVELLHRGELNVSEVAYQTGFSSPTHFSRVFKKAYGKTPSEV